MGVGRVTGSAVVLLSGGVDSAVVLGLVCSKLPNTEPVGLFIDYGQPASHSELAASEAVAQHYGVRYRAVVLRGFDPPAGEIRARNAFLVHTGLLVSPDASILAIGIHAGTSYRDCQPPFVELMQRSLDFHADGTVSLAAPLLDLSKEEVVELARSMAVPIARTYSCEAGNEPCGQCLSCKDRETFACSK